MLGPGGGRIVVSCDGGEAFVGRGGAGGVLVSCDGGKACGVLGGVEVRWGRGVQGLGAGGRGSSQL